MAGHPQSVQALVFSRDGALLASAGHDGIVRLWDAAGKAVGELKGHDKDVRTLAFGRDKQTLISAGFDKTLRTWDLKTRKERQRFVGHVNGVNAIATSPLGRTLFAASVHLIRVWDVTTGKQILPADGPENDGYCLPFAPNCQTLVCGTTDPSVHVWDLATTRQRQPRDGHETYVFSAAVSPEAKALAPAGAMQFA